MPDIGAADLCEPAGADGIEGEVHHPLPGLRILPRPRIGLAGSARSAQLGELHRSIAPHQLTPLLACGAAVVSLQKDYSPEDRAWLARHPEVLDFSHDLNDFADTAALARELDLVITVDTSITHVAGALGLPAWVLLSYIGDWRWMAEREDSPWYPAARLFRQSEVNDWDSVIARITAAVREWRNNAGHASSGPERQP